jgi:hypothetical protein
MSDALYHLHVMLGNRVSDSSAGMRCDYLMRTGKFAVPGRTSEDFEASLSGAMPDWAQQDPGLYWRMTDLFEREKAVLFREVEFALPFGIPKKDRLACAEKMAQSVAKTQDGNHPFTLALHRGKEKTGEESNWNCHVMVSERVNDGVSRDPQRWFSRVVTVGKKKSESVEELAERKAQLDPARGGAVKTRAMQPRKWLIAQRQNWQIIGNEALAKAGATERLDHRSYRDRGIEKVPQIHLGRKSHQMLQKDETNPRIERYLEIEGMNEARSEKAEIEEEIPDAQAAVVLEQPVVPVQAAEEEGEAAQKVALLAQQKQETEAAEAAEKAEVEAAEAAKKADALLIAPAVQSNRSLRSVADAIEKYDGAPVELTREQTSLVLDAFFFMPGCGRDYGKGRGLQVLLNLENGARTSVGKSLTVSSIASFFDLKMNSLPTGMQYLITVVQEKVAACVAALRGAAEVQLKRDIELIRSRARKLEQSQKVRVKEREGHER